MNVAALAAELKHVRLGSAGTDPDVAGITNDSRHVSPGMLYAALPGEHVDGHRFIPDAIAAGATAILCGKDYGSGNDPSVAWLHTDEPRLALSELSDRFYGSPSREIPVIGVTGTDGKTTTVYFIHQLLELCGLRSAFLSTAAMQIGRQERPNVLHQSTPEAPEVHRSIREMAQSDAQFAVLESTSHGLSLKSARLADVTYRAAVFTNISHEHLEFHGTFERYRSDKANLFRALDRNPNRSATIGVINAEDQNADYFAKATCSRIVRYGIDGDRIDYRADSLELSTTGTDFFVSRGDERVGVSLGIPGRFNVLNALAAVATVCELTGMEFATVAPNLAELRSVAGRMEIIAEEPFSVVVDYAHTPASFEHALPFFRDQCEGRLIAVFGSAGERDGTKRPLQGAVADRFCDVIILADEDPRGEDRMEILREIASGAPGRQSGKDLFMIPDRHAAIAAAFELARPGDTVVLLGKGHEASIIGNESSEPWNEAAVARELLGL